MFKTPTFPTIDPTQRAEMLSHRERTVGRSRARVVFDTDFNNEVDDYFALAWALASDAVEVEAIYAAPFSFRGRVDRMIKAAKWLDGGGELSEAQKTFVAGQKGQIEALRAIGMEPTTLLRDAHNAGSPQRGMETSADRLRVLLKTVGRAPEGLLFEGSPYYLSTPADERARVDGGEPGRWVTPKTRGPYPPVESDAAADLVARAKTASADDPLYVVSIGAPTNVASALLLDPTIIESIVVIWDAAYPTDIHDLSNPSFNLEQDVPAAQLLFSSGVPLVYMPGFYVAQLLSLSLPEVERWVRGLGPVGELLYQRFVTNPLLRYYGHLSVAARGYDWIVWDVICAAWVIDPSLVTTTLRDTPRLAWTRRRSLAPQYLWRSQAGAPQHLEGIGLSRSAVFSAMLDDLAG